MWIYPYGKALKEGLACIKLSGCEVNQNQPPAEVTHGINPGFAWYYQQFQLPENFVRGDDPTQEIIPEISGIQVKTQIPKHLMEQATIDYVLDWQSGDRWNTLSQGVSIGAAVHGDEVWFDIYFEKPATVTKAMLNATFRFGVRGRQTPPPHQRHKCLPIRRWGNKWYYYNYRSYYGGTFSEYGYDPFYLDYPYYEWGYYGFPYWYNYPWWNGYWEHQGYYWPWGFFPWEYPYGKGWIFPYGYYNPNFYYNWYWYHYGYPYAPFNLYDYIRDRFYPYLEDRRWWYYWDEWEYEGDSFPVLEFDNGVIPDDLEDLDEEVPYPIMFEGNYTYLYKHKKAEFDEQWGFHHQYCLHTQYGLPWLWFSYPNPYVRSENTYVTDENADQVLQNGDTISFMFRLMTLTADSGVDEFDQQYRNAVVIHSADNLNTTNSPDNQNANWISKPNPSKFAIETLYFDISDANNVAQVFDRIFIDPLTPGVYFNVYYSDTGLPASSVEEWENKIWTRVPKTYKLTKANSYALPTPLSTKYVAIELSHLQAKPYSEPDLASPIAYKKHPKWVLDYFLLRTDALRNDGSKWVSNADAITYNALDLAYNYYLDDLNQEPSGPPDLNAVTQFLTNTDDLSDKIDPTMAGQISTILKPYLTDPAQRMDRSMISQYAQVALGQSSTPYSTEIDPATQLPQMNATVSSLNRDEIIYEQSFPVMYFYIACKHVYRMVQANFINGVAYFAGIKSIAFQREHYTVRYDAPFYVEAGGDTVNIESNDLVRVDNAWTVYAKAKS